MSETGKPPSLRDIAEAQGLTYVEGLGIYSETGEALLQRYPDPEGLIDGCAYAIPEVVESSFTWATVFTNPPDLYYFNGLDPDEDTDNIYVTCWGDVPDLRELVADWRAQAREVKR